MNLHQEAQRLNEFWKNSPILQIILDGSRIALVFLVIFIAYTLVTNIEEVKILNSNPMRYFETKTNSTCTCIANSDVGKNFTYPEINMSVLDELIAE